MENTIIAVFCYKRAAKLRRCIEALLQNPECCNMEIVFFSDGPKGEADKEGVLATRDYISQLTGFKKIHTQFREQNLSTGPNFQQGLQWLSHHYQRFIVIEDDLVVAPNYLKYMLDALDFYQAQENVFSISGFTFPLETTIYRFDTVMHNRFCCYGWASWANRVKDVVWNEAVLAQWLYHTPHFKTALDREGRDLSRILDKQLTGKISTWDIQMQVQVHRNNMKVVYPVLSKAFNIGFDNESTNTFGIDYLKTNVDPGSQRVFRFCSAAIDNPRLQAQLRKPYSLPALATRKILNTLIKLTGRIQKAS